MLIKIHKAGGKKIVSIADKEIIGKEFEEGERYLHVSERFYKGEEKKEGEIIKILEDANSVNIVGKNSINFAVNNRLVDKESILTIKGIPCDIVVFNE